MDQVETFDEYRPLLFSIAYRMLGSVMDAEDMLQETFLRWQQAARSDVEIESPKAFLATIVTRLCIDQLRSARAQREQYIGPWLPEPLVTDVASAPAERSELAESLSLAFLVLLESLSPLERAVFLLREVFDYDYAEVAGIVGKSEANCRQVVRRARQHLAERRPRFEVAPSRQEELLDQFLRTCVRGDLDGLVGLLSEDVTLLSDGGGKVAAARLPVSGRDRVSRLLVNIFQNVPSDVEIRPVRVNGQAGCAAYQDGRPYGTLSIDLAGDRIRGIYLVLNPDKLRAMPPVG